MKWTNKGHELDVMSQIILEKPNQNYLIWGASTFGAAFYRDYCDELSVVGFIDSSPTKQGTLFCGLPVHPPQFMEGKAQSVCVLVSAGWTGEMFSTLKKLGFEKNVTCFHIDEFSTVYMWYKYKKMVISNLSFPITDRCSLKCKHCSAFTPYWPNPQNYKKEDIMHGLEEIFSVVDKANVFALVSGDTMMHPQFAEILDWVGSHYYGSHIGSLEVYTNAVIMPTKEELALFQKYNVYVRFSNYGEFVSNKQKIPEMIAVLEEHSIAYDHVQFEYWLDSGYPQESNGVVGDVNLARFFEHCDRRSCMSYYQGDFYYCTMVLCADRIDYCKKEGGDFFPVSKINEDNKLEFMEFMLGYSEKGYYEYCKKCNGSFNINRKKIPVGEQLP